MYDTANAQFAGVPSDADAIAPYMDANFNNVGAARARFPHLFAAKRVLTLTCRANDADGVDWEPGNTCPSPAGWYNHQHSLGRFRPCFYADLSDLKGTIVPSLGSIGVKMGAAGPSRPVRIFTAHPTQREHLCGPNTCGQLPFVADATQWWWSSLAHSTPDRDISTYRADFFQEAKPVPAPDPYAVFFDEKFVVTDPRTGKKYSSNEREAVMALDNMLKRPLKNVHLLIDGFYRVLAHRKYVWERAHTQALPNGKPSWGHDRRGERWHALNYRTQGL